MKQSEKSAEVYARILDEISGKLQGGHAVDLEVYRRRYPQFADRLSKLLPSMRALVRIGQAADSDQLTDEFLPSGRCLGDFRIVSEIARGGMGVVYEAEQQSLGRRVALKVLPFAAFLDDRQLERFRLEAHAAATLRHPNIVNVFCVGIDRGVHFYAMDLINGQSLADVIARRQQPADNNTHEISDESARVDSRTGTTKAAAPRRSDTLPIAAVTTNVQPGREGFRSLVELVVQVADALNHAHECGIVHRDIKPSNILIDQRGKPWITDFGLAQVHGNGSLTMSGDLLGTLRDMSPEQADGQGLVDRRTDVYSLGITLYELLTGEAAVELGPRQQMLRQIIAGAPVAPRRVNLLIPVDLETIVLKATRKLPADRYASAHELADDLRRFLQHQPPKARCASAIQHAWRWARRNPTVAISSTIIAMLLVALAVAGFTVARQQTRLARVSDRQRQEAIQREQSTRADRYRSDMDLALRLWPRGQFSQVISLLRRQIPERDEEDLRGFEWYHLAHRCRRGMETPTLDHRPLDPTRAHLSSIAVAAPATLATFSLGGSLVTLIDSRDFSTLHSIKADRTMTTSVSLTPDGRFLATCGEERMIRLWNTDSGQQIVELDNYAQVRAAIALAPSGDRIASAGYMASGNQNELFVWNVADQTAAKKIAIDADHVNGLAFSQDGRWLAAACNGGMTHVWDVGSFERIATLNGHVGEVLVATFVPGVRHPQLATTGSDGTICLWDLVTQQSPQRLTIGTPIHSLAFSTDGDLLVCGSRDGKVTVWNIGRRTIVEQFQAHRLAVTSTAFAKDNLELLTATSGQLSRWRRSDGRRLDHVTRPSNREPVTAALIHHLTFAPDDQTLFVSTGEDLRLWDRATLTERALLRGGMWEWSVQFSPCGRYFVANEFPQRVRLLTYPACKAVSDVNGHHFGCWNSAGDQFATVTREGNTVELLEFPAGKVTGRLRSSDNAEIVTGAFAEEGRLFVAYERGKDAHDVWDLSSQTRVDRIVGRPLKRPFDEEHTTCISPNGDYLVVQEGDRDDLVVVRVSTGETVRRFSTHTGTPVASFSSDGRWLALSGNNNSVVLFELQTASTRQLSPVHGAELRCLRFSPDGQLLGSASRDGIARIWQIDTGQLIDELHGHSGAIETLSFSRSGRQIATGSHDLTVKLWEIGGNDRPDRLKCSFSSIAQVAFSHDGKALTVVATDLDGKRIIAQCDPKRGQEVERFEAGSRIAHTRAGEIVSVAANHLGLRLWSTASSRPLILEPDHKVRRMAFSPRGRFLATSEMNNRTVKLWDTSTGQLIAKYDFRFSTMGLAFSPDGKCLAVGGGSKNLFIVNPLDGQMISHLAELESGVERVVFSSDGRLLAAYDWAGNVVVWNTLTNRRISRFRVTPSSGPSMAFTPDANRLAIAAEDQHEISLWNPRTGELVGTLIGHDASITSLAFSPDGLTLASGDDAGVVRLWRGLSSAETEPFVRTLTEPQHSREVILGAHNELSLHPL